MFTNLKRQWHQLRRWPPGERFVRRYEAQKQRPRRRTLLRRLVLMAVALVLIAIGIVLMFIPGPAILFFFLAGALLAEESRAVARLLDWSELQLRHAWKSLRRWWAGRSSAAKGALCLGLVLGASASLYVTFRVFT